MPQTIRQQLIQLKRELISSERWVDALFEVHAPDGEVIIRVGGLWDTHLKRYVERPGRTPVAHVATLKWSQVPMARALADYVYARLAGDDARAATILGIGNRGSGKTYLLGGIWIAVLAIALPRTWQMCVNVNTKNKKEIEDAIEQVIPRRWVRSETKDNRDPRIDFITGSGLFWMTSKNLSAMRMGQLKFEHVLINEAQDQSVKVYSNAMGAIRTGGCVTIATNGSQGLGGDWVVALYYAIQSATEENEFHGRDGVGFVLDNKLNDVVHQPTMKKGARLVRAVDPEAAAVDFDGAIKLSGDLAYPSFSRLPYRVEADGKESGGHVGNPPPDWIDVTREETKKKAGSEFDYVGLSDFQKNPGSCLVACKVFRKPNGKLALWCKQFITTQGREWDLSQACINQGYYPAGVDLDGKPAASMCIIGDATGDRLSASHRRNEPYSWVALREAGGWTIIAADRFWKSKLPRNPDVDDSRKQMHSLFLNYQILIAPECGETPREQEHGGAAFPSLIDGFLKSKVYPSGAFVKRGHWTHGPDGVRYGAWCLLDRPRPLPRPLPAPDMSVFAVTAGKSFGKG